MSTQRAFPEGLIGKKIGMTQLFLSNGQCVPVTAIQVGPCYILDVKTPESHGYSAVQLGFEPKKTQRVNRALMGHFAKSGKGGFYHVREMRCDVNSLGWTTLGQELNASDVFKEGAFVDVSGVSIGRGFAGVFKRYGMRGQPSTRGTHEERRNVGSIGCRKTPGRVFKNKRLPGHLGNENVTIQNLEVLQVRPEENVIFVKGGIPGNNGGFVVVRKATKKSEKKAA